MTHNVERYTQEEAKDHPLDTVLIKRLLAYLKPYRFWTIFAIIILIISRAIEAWIPIQIGWLVQLVLDYQGRGELQSRELFERTIASSFDILGWTLLSYLLDTLNILIKNWIGQKAVFNLRTQVYEHIQKLPMPYYDRAAIGRLMTRTIHDVEQINQLLSESVIPLIGSVILFVGIFIGVFILDWRIGLLICVIFPAIWWLTNHFRYHQRVSYDALRSILSAMNTFMQEHLMGVHVVRNFGLYASEKQKFEEINQDYYQVSLDAVHQFSLFFAGIEFLQNLTMISVFILLVAILPTGARFEAGTYFTIGLYSVMVFRPLFDFAERYNILQSAMAAAERVFAILDTPLEPTGPSPGLPLREIETIVFDQVWFAYEAENWVLKGLSFTLHKGESVALVGITGSGKTSVMNLLLRFYEFQKGNILINGKDIRQYNVEDLRQQFSVILQDPVIFSGTIQENIALYDPSITPQQVEASAEYVNLTPTVKHFPDGFQHILRERGISLSVGEMQLISLARAVVHHRSVVLFDEATASIDAPTEKLIQDSLSKVLKNRTALVIAHRLSTIRDVDHILVLSQGVVVERGTHQQLLKAQGIYEKLYRLQFSA